MEDRAGRLVAAIREKNEGYSERNRESPNIVGNSTPPPNDKKGG